MTLTGWKLYVSLVAVFLAGAAGGTFAAGWARTRGVPIVEANADAGVSVSIDAGVSSSAELKFELGHWQLIPLAPSSGGVEPPRSTAAKRPGSTPPPIAEPTSCVCPGSFLLVPDVSLSGSNKVTEGVSTNILAHAETGVRVAPAELELDRHWEVGPSWLHGLKSGDNLFGLLVGGNLGPLGLRGQALGGERQGADGKKDVEFYVGAAAVYRFPP